jgi:serine/threonine protein kinase
MPSVRNLLFSTIRSSDQGVRKRVVQLQRVFPASLNRIFVMQAAAIEAAIFHLRTCGASFLLRKRPNVPLCSFMLSNKAGAIFLMLSRKDFLVGEGSGKRVILCLRFPYDASFNLCSAVKKVSKISRDGDKVNMGVTTGIVRDFCHELSVVPSVPNTPEILMAFQYVRYETDLDNHLVPVRKIVVFEEKYEQVSSLVGRIDVFPVLLSISIALATQLVWIHENNVIHGDLKLGNALYTNDGRATWTDWAFSAHASVEIRFPMTAGFYGSLDFTPPEVFGVSPPFNGNFFKVESWAFGIFLYEFFFKERLPWGTWLRNFYVTQREPQSIDRGEFFAKIYLFLDEKLKGTENPALTQVQILIRELLNSSPEHRPSMQEVVDRLCKISKIDLA